MCISIAQVADQLQNGYFNSVSDITELYLVERELEMRFMIGKMRENRE